MSMASDTDTCDDCTRRRGRSIKRSHGTLVIAGGGVYRPGGGYSGATKELDDAVAREANLLVDLFDRDVEVRFNSDRHSGGAYIDLPCQGTTCFGDIGISVRAIPRGLPASPKLPPGTGPNGEWTDADRANWNVIQNRYDAEVRQTWYRYERGEVMADLAYHVMLPLASVRKPELFPPVGDYEKRQPPWKREVDAAFINPDAARRWLVDTVDMERVHRLLDKKPVEGFVAPHWQGYSKRQGRIERRYLHEDFYGREPPSVYLVGTYDEVTRHPKPSEVRNDKALPIAFDMEDAEKLIQHRQPFVFVMDAERVRPGVDNDNLNPYVNVGFEQFYNPDLQGGALEERVRQQLLPYEEAMKLSKRDRMAHSGPYHYLGYYGRGGVK